MRRHATQKAQKQQIFQRRCPAGMKSSSGGWSSGVFGVSKGNRSDGSAAGSRNAADTEASPPGGKRDSRFLAPSSTWDEGRVRAQLDRILASPAFNASARNRAFLRYIVNETLAGRADRIKGYTVGQAVFDRDADFDPQLDPVVRIGAGNLRRSLEHYYLTAGKDDRLIIDVPKGGYVPRFATRADAPAPRRPGPFLFLSNGLGTHILPALLVIAVLLFFLLLRISPPG
ncbi:MAG TPA: hypothetical protein VMQ11_01175 [Alphaproteobacteria bacterium]|nr:hypothetical protein [Alphaproteobacteria bacterium]